MDQPQPLSLAAWMRENDVTDRALAQRIGVSRPFITHIRNGNKQPSLSVAVKLVEATGLPAEAFQKAAAA